MRDKGLYKIILKTYITLIEVIFLIFNNNRQSTNRLNKFINRKCNKKALLKDH